MFFKKQLGTLVIISAPSGGGKTTVINRLVEILPKAHRLVTSTTRLPRPHERQGVDYHFLSKEAFEKKIERGDFVEHVIYASNYYGVDRHELETLRKSYHYVLAPIDIRGKRNLERAKIPFVSIFLLPESLDVLAARLARRPNMSAEEVAERLRVAEEEIKEARDYQFRLTNREGHFDDTVEEIVSLLTKSKA